MFSALKNGESTVEEMFSRPEKQTDPNYNPLIKTGKAQQQGDDEAALAQAGNGTGAPAEAASETTSARPASPATADAAAAGDDVARGEAASDGQAASPPPAVSAEVLKEYSEALLRAQQPKSLPTVKDQFWKDRPHRFDAASNEKLKNVYTAHLRRCTREIDENEMDKIIAEIIAR
jgi:hypothetical protein